jgi:hypothetical protein
MDRRQELINEIKRKQLIASIREKQSAPQAADEVTDTMPDWLDTSDRAAVKNLANNDEESLKYLQGKYADAEFKKGADGEIIARKKGEKTYGKLDPSFSPFSNPLGTLKDLGRDALDIGYDVVQGGAEALGAAGGAMAGLGIGSLPAAMAGGAAGSAAASTLKESLRKKLGISDEFSMGNIAQDALIGGAMPGVLHGAGKALKYGAKTLAPSLYSKATGVSANSLKRIADKGDDIAKWNEIDAGNVLGQMKGDVDGWVSGKKGEFAQKYKQIRGMNSDVDTADLIKMIDDEIAKADAQALANPGTNAFKEAADEFRKMKSQIFSDNVSQMKMDINDAIDLDGKISNDWIDWAPDAGQGVGTGRTVSSQQQELAKNLRNRLRGNVDSTSGGEFKNAAGDYSQFVDQINFIRKNFKDPKKIQGTLEALDKGKNLSLAAEFQKLDPALIKQIEQARGDLDLYRYFKPMNTSLLSEEGLKDLAVGKAPIEKLLTALGTGAGYVSGGAVGGVVGAGVGRGAGKLIASPTSVKMAAKTGKKIGKKMDSLEKMLKDNPELLYMLYGAGTASTR